MATIRREAIIEARPETAWDALRDVAALHTRVTPGFVTDVRMEPGARVVTFANGMVARELIVTVDDDERRLVWAMVDGPLSHHNGVVQIHPYGASRTRFVWTADLLPEEMEPKVAGMMDIAMPIIKKTLEAAERQLSGAEAGPL